MAKNTPTCPKHRKEKYGSIKDKGSASDPAYRTGRYDQRIDLHFGK